MKKALIFCRAIDSVNERVGRIASFAVLPLVILVAIEVLARYALNRPTIFAWDINIQLYGLLVMLGAGYALLTKGHVVVDVIITHFSPKVRAILELITSSFFFLCTGTLMWTSAGVAWESTLSKESYTSIWSPPIYPFKIMIFVGGCLLLLQGIAKFIRDIAVIASKEGDWR